MAQTPSYSTRRTLIVLLTVAAGVLAFAIGVAAYSPSRLRAAAALAEAKSQAEEDRKNAADRIERLEAENADLKKRLALATADVDRQAEKLAAAEKELVRLRADLEAALKKAVDLSQELADARIKADAAMAETREVQRKAKLAIDAAQKASAAKLAAAEKDNVRAVDRKSGARRPGVPGARGWDNNRTANRFGGPRVSLPRTCPSFSELDKDHDGRLTLEEYKAGFPDAEDVEKEFKALDTSGKGWLTIDEYKAGHPDPPVVRGKRPNRAQ